MCQDQIEFQKQPLNSVSAIVNIDQGLLIYLDAESGEYRSRYLLELTVSHTYCRRFECLSCRKLNMYSITELTSTNEFLLPLELPALIYEIVK